MRPRMEKGVARRVLLIGGASLALSACGEGLIGPPPAGTLYRIAPDFGSAPGAGTKVAWALAIMRPNMATGLDVDRVVLIQPDGTLDFYAKANYPDRLGVMLQQAILNGFEASGRIDAVALEQDALHADYSLDIEVKDFAAHYSEPDGIPVARVSITVKLTTAHGRAIVGSFSTTKTATASLNGVTAVTQALQQALGQAVPEIVNWTLAAPMPAAQTASGSSAKPAEELLHDMTQSSSPARKNTPQ
jgi:cholesterol transport system auxiliary component